MITEVTVLKATCSKCPNRADYRVVQTNDDLKDKVASNGLTVYATCVQVLAQYITVSNMRLMNSRVR